MTIEINDIQKRNHMNSTIYKSSQMNLNHIPLYTKDHRFIKENAFHIIEHWQSIDPSDSHSSFLKAMDAFDEVCEHCSDGEINKCYIVLSEAVTKVRDATQLANSIKHRTSRFKTKISTKINNSIDNINGANTAKLHNISNKLAAAIKPVETQQPNGDTSGVAQESYYQKLNEKINEAVECDRIIRNYNRISKRFNFDRMVSDIYDESLIYECIVEMCRCIDTYNTGFINKYETALENTYYVLNKKYLNYPNDKIVEAVTDYFVIEKSITENEIETIERLKKNNNCIFKESDFDQVKYLFNKETIDSDLNVASVVPDPSGYGVDFFTLNEDSLVDKAKNKIKKLTAGDETKEKDEVKKMIDEFRASCVTTKEKQGEIGNQHLNNLKSLIRKIYTKSPEQISAGLPNVFTILRTFFIISPCAINPILSIPALIADQAIKLTLERTNLDKMVTAYKNEINLIQTKIEKEKNQENKSRLEAYLKELNRDMEKIKKYEEDLYSEEENEKRKEAEYSFDDDFEFDDDEDWDDEDWDDEDFEESHTQLLNLSSVILISELTLSSQELLSNSSVNKTVRDNIVKFSNESLDELTDFSLIVPDILSRTALVESMENHREQLRAQESKSISDLVRIDCLSENIYKLQNSATTYNATSDMKSIICTLNCLNELANYTSSNYIMEMNFTNSIKLAINRLKKTTMKLDTKQKQISNTIDVSMNNVSKGLETAMMNDNRESVIRGRVLPSASKVIKLAITTGVAWAVNPAVAVIGAIGAFACSKKLKAKERQLVLDDIEIELKMCERYLRQAEDKNDMQAIRQIEITQRNLQRQQQRIKYKMNVVYKQNVPDIKNEDD